MRETVTRGSANSEYWFHEGCHILEFSNRPEDPAVSITRARVAPGGTTRWHRLHGITERYLVLEGAGLVEVGEGLREAVGPGDTVHIPPLVRQRITNTGDTDLVFLAICTPRFEETAYEAL
ncbi:MAG: cupin domain-containing protein [Gammaproteobacteria bacterium]|nr:cupin domain-containing protein [Gammaproteobacteria bacterium]